VICFSSSIFELIRIALGAVLAVPWHFFFSSDDGDTPNSNEVDIS
jgi:hypothetical protein